MFNEDFFFFYEDLELSFRQQLLGYKCLYLPSALVYHHGRATIRNFFPVAVKEAVKNSLITLITCTPFTMFKEYVLDITGFYTKLIWEIIKKGYVKEVLFALFYLLRNFHSILLRRKRLQKDHVKNDYLNSILYRGDIFINFPDEVSLGRSLARVFNTTCFNRMDGVLAELENSSIRNVIENAENGYLSPDRVQVLLDAAGIPRAGEAVVASKVDAVLKAEEFGFPVVMKVVGPLHKSDIGGVILDIRDTARVSLEFERMIQLEGVQSVMIQPMLSGTELFAGVKREGKFGHLILCGMGGIFVEAVKDVNAGLAPLGEGEAAHMVKSLQVYPVLEGIRGQEGIDIPAFIDILNRLSQLVTIAPEIAEMDLNPMLGTKAGLVAVDARIRVEKEEDQKK